MVARQSAGGLVSPGQLLKQGRELQGWTTQEVARRLNLRTAVVVELETDSPDPRTANTFIRGYLRAYAKLVGVNEELVLASFEQLLGHHNRPELQSFSQRMAREASDNRLTILTYLLAACLLAMSLWWWFQERQQSHEPVSPTTMSETDTQLPETIGNYEPRLYSPVAEEVGTDFQDRLDSSADSSRDLTPLVLSCSAHCWIRVEDATGAQLALGTQAPEQMLEMAGRPPFRIILGAPEVVRLTFAGELVDLSRFAPGERVELTLPEQY